MKNGLILKVKDLNVLLNDQSIIESLSFEVKRGDALTILGPNGAGKSVLLKTLLGLIPHRGEIEWAKGVKIGFVPQRLPFIKDIPLSIKDFFNLKGSPEKETEAILNSVGFKEDFSRKKIGDLSSGQFQRVLIAWGLVGNPQVLLFDEPMTGVDISAEETIYNLLAKLKGEMDLTILLVTHDLSVVYKFSTDVICLNRQPICYGPPQEVLTPESLQRLYGGEVKYYQHKH
ncbi:MAG: ABC transporter ATP-binding protein [Deltaproteobacteria bacterium CG_4_8_14_3_um_filter_45_9]|nr:MAG: ABC transporter ATP-binding protein [Deltaproteobacteria bacterium CG_4_8_14_3_um_filter_45_9]